MGIDIEKIRQISKNFTEELDLAHSGSQTSLAYIVHNLPATPLVTNDQIFQVMTIGGSVFRKALLKRHNGTLITLTRDEKSLPMLHTKDDLLLLVESEIDPQVEILAINFAYPLQPVFENNKLDGILVRGSKEHTFEGLISQKVGSSLEDYFATKHNRPLKISIANDTIALLLSGLTEVANRDIAAGIVGTGMNFAFFINEHQVVNLEAAYFDKFPQSDEGKLIDERSVEPGTALYEKETAGAYLYHHYNLLLKKKNISSPPINSTFAFDRILEEQAASQEAALAKSLMEYSASLIAALISGITESKKKDMTFVMEGSLFWHGRGYIESVKRQLRHLSPDYSITFIKIEDSPILGAAKLVS